jgi:methyl-accepting chemotaxis protein
MQEIATATDRTAESADAMGTMVTEAIGSADNVAQEIQDVAAANEELTAQTEEIATAVKRLTEAEAERSADLPSSGSDVHSR